MDDLTAVGLVNPAQLVRIGAAELVARCLATWRSQGSTDPQVLAQMIRQGGPSVADQPRKSERQRILDERNLWQKGYDENGRIIW